MISRTIHTAIDSGLFDQVFVSTEDAEIKKISITSGANIIDRNPELADDNSGTIEVMKDAIKTLLEKEASIEDLICCIYPATPLLNYDLIAKARELMNHFGNGLVFPVCAFQSPIQRSFGLNVENKIVLPKNNLVKTRTQDLENFYFDPGQFYLGTVKSWMSETAIISETSHGIVIGKYDALDIDTEEDWQYAEALYRIRNHSKENRAT